MYKIKILTIGKTKEKWLELAALEYTKRLHNQIDIEWVILKSIPLLEQACSKETIDFALDPLGEDLKSEDFSRLVLNQARRTFVIGGADGLTLPMKTAAKKLIRLSSLTFTHQMTRLILLEQLYRASEIKKGSQYHK